MRAHPGTSESTDSELARHFCWVHLDDYLPPKRFIRKYPIHFGIFIEYCTAVDNMASLSPRKKSNFYGRKKDVVEEDFSDATARCTPSAYIPTVRKLAVLTSSESESDSDIENATGSVRKADKINIDEGKTDDIIRTPKHSRSDESHEDQNSTPPKQGRYKPSGSSLTPSTLLDRLDLSPKKERIPSRRQLFGSDRYQNARLALHSSATEDMPGRESEVAKLREFLGEHLGKQTSGSLYISGPPGTGKTACLSKIMQRPEIKSKLKIVYINCTTMKSAAAIYAKIIQELHITDSKKSARNGKAIIEEYLVSRHKMLLLVLDEIDQLESRKQAVLYTIFEWPSLPGSRLVLVGIANALDLTDRILPRLQSRCELKPMLMHFASYTKQQIFDIISARLNRANASDVFTPPAIQMLAGKVAAISGDIRRALDISRRMVELAESHKAAQVLRLNNNNDTNVGTPKKQTDVMEKPVDLKEVVTLLNGVYGGTQNLNQEQDTFPLQQKLLLCSLLLILNKGRNKDVTVGRLHEVYRKVCKKRNICAVDSSEFVSLCSLIETRGILRIVGKKEPRLSKVNLQWDQEELDLALQDKNMMAEIINDKSCL